jgi:hypothetical protein
LSSCLERSCRCLPRQWRPVRTSGTKIHVVSADLGRWTRTSIWMVASTLVRLVLNRGQRKFLS